MRLIDADKIGLTNFEIFMCQGSFKAGLQMILQKIADAPTIEQPTGHWILIDEELSRYKCSECGEVIKLYKKSEISRLEKDETLSDYPFSHCGCRMIEPTGAKGSEE